MDPTALPPLPAMSVRAPCLGCLLNQPSLNRDRWVVETEGLQGRFLREAIGICRYRGDRRAFLISTTAEGD